MIPHASPKALPAHPAQAAVRAWGCDRSVLPRIGAFLPPASRLGAFYSVRRALSSCADFVASRLLTTVKD